MAYLFIHIEFIPFVRGNRVFSKHRTTPCIIIIIIIMATMTIDITEQAWGHGLGLSPGQQEPEHDLLTPFELIPERMAGRTV
jgi:hypothetical protein